MYQRYVVTCCSGVVVYLDIHTPEINYDISFDVSYLVEISIWHYKSIVHTTVTHPPYSNGMLGCSSMYCRSTVQSLHL